MLHIDQIGYNSFDGFRLFSCPIILTKYKCRKKQMSPLSNFLSKLAYKGIITKVYPDCISVYNVHTNKHSVCYASNRPNNVGT